MPRDDVNPPTPRRSFLRTALVSLLGILAGLAGLAAADADRGGEETGPLFVEDLGDGMDGRRIVFIPGLGATGRYWEPRMRPLASRARLTFVDLLGFGRSPKPWATYSVARHVAELHRVLAPRAAFTLVGHSIGARIAVAYAATYPSEVTQLLLVAMPYFGGERQAKAYLREREPGGWVWTNMVAFALVCLLSRRLFGWAMPFMARGMPPEVTEDLAKMTWRSSTSTMWEVIYRYDLAVDVARLPPAMPMHCLHGDADTSAPLDRLHALHGLHPAFTIHVVAGGDHQLVIKKPKLVREWVARQIQSTTA